MLAELTRPAALCRAGCFRKPDDVTKPVADTSSSNDCTSRRRSSSPPQASVTKAARAAAGSLSAAWKIRSVADQRSVIAEKPSRCAPPELPQQPGFRHLPVAHDGLGRHVERFGG